MQAPPFLIEEWKKHREQCVAAADAIRQSEVVPWGGQALDALDAAALMFDTLVKEVPPVDAPYLGRSRIWLPGNGERVMVVDGATAAAKEERDELREMAKHARAAGPAILHGLIDLEDAELPPTRPTGLGPLTLDGGR